MLKINLWPESRNFLEKVPQKHRKQLATKLSLLRKNPFPVRSKKLEGFEPLYRLRSGDYRIVYFVSKDILNIPLIESRNDDKIYRRIRNLLR